MNSNPASTTTPLSRTATLAIDKVAGTPTDVNGSGLTDAGDTIAYTFTVTNTGNVTVTGVRVDDPLLAGNTITCAATTLAPGASTTCTPAGPYTVTEADEAATAVVNTATAVGTDPTGTPVVSPPDTTTVPVDAPAPVLTLVKTAGAPTDVNGSGLTDAGDTIAYTFVVTNDGNVPVTAIVVDDPMLSGTPLTCVDSVLAPGASTNCGPVSYTVTAGDETAGAVDNTAVARGTDPDGGPVASPPATTSTPTQTPNPRLSIVKTAATPVDVNSSGLTDAGDTIDYTFVVTNTGNVPLTAVAVVDDLVAVACPATSLAPGASMTCGPVTYTVTTADEAAGAVVNIAHATGTDPDGDPIDSPPDTTDTPTQSPAPGADDRQVGGDTGRCQRLGAHRCG